MTLEVQVVEFFLFIIKYYNFPEKCYNFSESGVAFPSKSVTLRAKGCEHHILETTQNKSYSLALFDERKS